MPAQQAADDAEADVNANADAEAEADVSADADALADTDAGIDDADDTDGNQLPVNTLFYGVRGQQVSHGTCC